MPRQLITVLAVVTLISSLSIVAVPPGKTNPPPGLSTLQPGGYRDLEQNLKINVVFVGYEKGTGPRDIDENIFLAGLPGTSRTILRYPAYYGLPAGLGINFSYDYKLVYADSTFEGKFFNYLSSIAVPQDLTPWQVFYNGQAKGTLDVANNNWIDAPSVEKWLADNGGSIGVDTTEYTVFFINWYDRSDFKFHVYTKTDEPDPDTGYNFGQLRFSRKMIAWGGTTPDDEESGLGSLHRIWFYDLSAGPEFWTGNWNVDDADLNGNGIMDYRMPPVWEYGNPGAYRSFDDLSGDLAKVTRYVALDLLFTTSPLYKPAISPPKLPHSVQLDINVYQGEPGVDARQYFKPALIASELGKIQPLNNFTTEIKDWNLDARARQVLLCWANGPSCFGNRLFGISFADLYLYHADHLIQYLEGDADYEIPIFAYNLTNNIGTGSLLGYADDNWRNGTQSFVFGFDSPDLRSLGYGFTTTMIHETGHHLGMSHPHDGYDYEGNVDFGPSDEFYFVNVGDESNSIMSYIDLNWDFSQFDRDNMNRYMTSAYINQANSILASIYRSPRAGEAGILLGEADAEAKSSLVEYQARHWAGAASHASAAYGKVLQAAAKIQVQVEPQSWQADYKAKGLSSKFIDKLDYHRSAP